MRNSAIKYNQTHSQASCAYRFLASLFMATWLISLATEATGQNNIRINREDMVAIRADEAWEAEEPDTIHFSGRFEMRIRDMVLKANSASLFGKLENPDRLVLKGAPARFTLSEHENERDDSIRAEAQEIIYERETKWVFLNGGARLSQGDRVLSSIAIEYNIETDRFRTRDVTGVEIKVNKEN